MKKKTIIEKSDRKYYVLKEILLSKEEAKKNKDFPSKEEKTFISFKEAEMYLPETLTDFLNLKKQEIKIFLENHGCIINPPSGNNCPLGKKGKYIISLHGTQQKPQVQTIFKPDDFREKRLLDIYFFQLRQIQDLFDNKEYDRAVIYALSVGEDISRLMRMEHVQRRYPGANAEDKKPMRLKYGKMYHDRILNNGKKGMGDRATKDKPDTAKGEASIHVLDTYKNDTGKKCSRRNLELWLDEYRDSLKRNN